AMPLTWVTVQLSELSFFVSLKLRKREASYSDLVKLGAVIVKRTVLVSTSWNSASIQGLEVELGGVPLSAVPTGTSIVLTAPRAELLARARAASTLARGASQRLHMSRKRRRTDPGDAVDWNRRESGNVRFMIVLFRQDRDAARFTPAS